MAPKILIIDDDRLNIALLKFAFKEKGYDVFTAIDGEDGIKSVKMFKPEIILLDIQMPNMNGFEFMGEIKTIPGGAAIPVLILTANDSMQDVFFSEGVKGYYVKPVDPVKIEAKVRQVLGITGDIKG